MCGFRWGWPRWRPTGVERLGRPGVVSLRGGLILAGVLVALSIPIMIYIYVAGLDRAEALDPALSPRAIPLAGPRAHRLAILRTGLLALAGLVDRAAAARTLDPVRRARRAAILPLLVMADLLSAHWVDVPTVDPRYWTEPPESARR